MLARPFIWFAPDMTRKELTDFVGETGGETDTRLTSTSNAATAARVKRRFGQNFAAPRRMRGGCSDGAISYECAVCNSFSRVERIFFRRLRFGHLRLRHYGL